MAVKVLDKAYVTQKDIEAINEQYSERTLKKKEAKTKEYIEAVVAGPEPDIIVESARIKRLMHEINNPEKIDDAEWHRMQLRMCKKGFDEGAKIYKVLRAVYELNHDIKIAHQIRETVFNYSLLQDGVRPHYMDEKSVEQWEARHGKFQYIWDGENIISASGKAKFKPGEFKKFKDDNKVVKAMMAAAKPITQMEEEEEDYER